MKYKNSYCELLIKVQQLGGKANEITKNLKLCYYPLSKDIF